MGSGNSSPVGCAKTVETEAHQNVFELRFDHLAVGGTAFIVLLIVLGLYWLYHQRWRNKSRQRRHRKRNQSRSPDRDQRDNHHLACCHSQHPWYPMPLFLPLMMPSQAANPWISMEVLSPSIYDTSRFTELQEARAPATAGQPPTRPPLPRELRCPSPHSRSTAEETAWRIIHQ